MSIEQVVVIGGWALSLAALAATVAVVVWLVKQRQEAEPAVTAWAAYTLGMFATVLLLVLSQKCAGMAISEGEPVVIGSVLNTLDMFDLNREIELDVSALEWLGPALPVYLVYNAALFLAAPVGVIGTIVSLLGEVLVLFRVQYRARSADAFVLSGLTRASLALAKSILKGAEKAPLVVFANVKDRGVDLASDAKNAGALCVPQSIHVVADKIHSAKHSRNYVLTCPDEARNLNDGISLARSLAKRWMPGSKAPAVLVFSSSRVGESVIDAIAAEVNPEVEDKASETRLIVKVELRRVNWVRNVVNSLLDSRPLFTTGLEEGALKKGAESDVSLAFDYGPDTRRILVVGDGEFAREFLKGALWASQMGEDVKTRVDVVAADKAAFKSRLAFDAPALFPKDERFYSGHFDLHIEEYDPQSGDYLDFLLNCEEGDFTYVLVALDDDLACAQVARRTREVLEQRRLKSGFPHPPFIAAAIQSDELADSISGMKARDYRYAIEPIGRMADAFSYESVFALTHYGCAKNLNCIYSGIDKAANDEAFSRAVQDADAKFMNSEYSQRSSLASALHRKYSLYLACRMAGDDVKDPGVWTKSLSAMSNEAPELFEKYLKHLAIEENMERLAAVEHDRWNAYVMTEGYEPADRETIREHWSWLRQHYYDLARLHACLTDYDRLPELSEAVTELKGKDTDFQSYDQDILRATKVIAAEDEETFRREWRSFYRTS